MSIDQRYVLMGNYRFVVEIDNTPIGFARVGGIQMEMEYEVISEGGVNAYVHTVVKPATQARTMTFEKGISLAGADSIGNLGLYPGRVIKEPIGIEVMANSVRSGQANSKKFSKYYRVPGCMVTKWELGGLDAMQNEILIEKFEIVCYGVEEYVE